MSQDYYLLERLRDTHGYVKESYERISIRNKYAHPRAVLKSIPHEIGVFRRE